MVTDTMGLCVLCLQTRIAVGDGATVIQGRLGHSAALPSKSWQERLNASLRWGAGCAFTPATQPRSSERYPSELKIIAKTLLQPASDRRIGAFAALTRNAGRYAAAELA